MKKKYQNPTTGIFLLSTGSLLVYSNGLLGDGETPKPFNPNKDVNETTETSGNLSRHYSVWDDEEGEEY